MSYPSMEDKIKLLAKLAQKTGLPGTSQKLAVLLPKSSKLAVYKESVEVAKILKDMLDDIATRRIVIDKVDEHVAVVDKVLDCSSLNPMVIIDSSAAALKDDMITRSLFIHYTVSLHSIQQVRYKVQ